MRFFLSFLSFFLTLPAWGNPVPWVAFGDLRGYVAPCGCDPLTDLGGIRRLTHFVHSTQKLHPDVLIFNLGNNASLKGESDKNKAIAATIQLIKPTASLWRGGEMRLADKSTPYVFSHSKTTLPANVQTFILQQGVLVIGFNESAPNALPFTRQLQTSWQKQIKAHKPKHTVLLFAGKDATLKAIEKSALFNEIISANTLPPQTEPTQLEKEEPGRLLRTANTYMVPSFGQGVLLGGPLRNAPRLSLPLDCKSGSLEPRCQKKPEILTAAARITTWLDGSWNAASAADAIFSAYNAGAADAFIKRALDRRKDLKTSPFASASACASCHPAAYAAWEKSRHARAWNTLKVRHKDKDGECISCHVVGYDAKGGFADMESSPQFANVQCENCHGAAREHAANPQLKPSQKARAACAGCHTAPHSPRFDADTYWQKIKH